MSPFYPFLNRLDKTEATVYDIKTNSLKKIGLHQRERRFMPFTKNSRMSGKASAQVISSFVALAFIALCGVMIFSYFKDNGKDPSSATGDKPQATQEGLRVKLYSSSAKGDWNNEMVKRFNNSRQKVGGLQILRP
jgi:hypothetical protein